MKSAQAQVLLDDATIEPGTVRSCRSYLTSFLDRYLPLFHRREQGDNAEVVLRGLLSDLERKTCEPIARREGVELDAHAREIPHAWIVADDDFGRAAEFRSQLRTRGEPYILDVPCDTLIRDLEARRPPRRRRASGPRKETPFRRVDEWLKRQPPSRWERLRVSDGEKGPLEVQAMTVRVRARHERGIGDEERLLVLRTVEDNPRIRFSLSSAGPEVSLAELVRVGCQRHRIEELFEAAKGEAGLHEYEVRSWVGWHHHMTLSLLALWFLTLERGRLGGKNPGSNGPTDAEPPFATAS